ncbi:BgTH12-00590 [Blumeria graminis f. sp. triticale]|uniref:MICOS complex subunit MIC12 n=1 Tax=Blumeria graminis f. sp. triticale TaxID=1689686 RepID=A0A9W4D770_BLUGR|nr:BgTH12-00590 [Blumeria graminis f. sp. triticale]
MGFIRGFSGGAAMTLGMAYWTVRTHHRHRYAQSSALKIQAEQLAATEIAVITPTRAEPAPKRQFSIMEMLKARWNAEIIAGVDWLHRTDWNSLVWKLWALGSRSDQLGLDHDSNIADYPHTAELHEPTEAGTAFLAQAGQPSEAPATTDVAAALEQRYYRPLGSEKSIAETLKDRYQPR